MNLTVKRPQNGIKASSWKKVINQNQNTILKKSVNKIMRKISVITGSRADYGLLKWLILFLQKDKHKIKPNSYSSFI